MKVGFENFVDIERPSDFEIVVRTQERFNTFFQVN